HRPQHIWLIVNEKHMAKKEEATHREFNGFLFDPPLRRAAQYLPQQAPTPRPQAAHGQPLIGL
ncbi:MAG: hypothetical protein J5U19_15250, partial [Candidatus Methanoperedens sp.]|nr:hypothetical protein [Candidatus Methanoperedens sp.]